MVIGIDEAGRGPAIGPLSIGIVRWDNPNTPPEITIDDSKAMDEVARKASASWIMEQCDYKSVLIPAWVIDKSDSLPKLEARVIVDALYGWHTDESILCDYLSNGRSTHDILKVATNNRINFEKSADDKFKAVGAASIIAKVNRDESIKDISSKHGDVGSGYPSDPNTREWIENTGSDLPPVVRKSWSTVADLA